MAQQHPCHRLSVRTLLSPGVRLIPTYSCKASSHTISASLKCKASELQDYSPICKASRSHMTTRAIAVIPPSYLDHQLSEQSIHHTTMGKQSAGALYPSPQNSAERINTLLFPLDYHLSSPSKDTQSSEYYHLYTLARFIWLRRCLLCCENLLCPLLLFLLLPTTRKAGSPWET